MQRSIVLFVLAGAVCSCAAQQGSLPPLPGAPATSSSPVVGSVLTAFESKALLALSPSGAIPGTTATGTVDRVVGAFKESGTVKLTSGTNGQESEEWTLSSGERLFTKTAFTGRRTCSVQLGGKDVTQQLDLGCQRIVPWFAPWAALAALNSQTASAMTVTTSADTASGAVRLRFVPAYGDLKALPTNALQSVANQMQVSAVDVVFDGLTALPRRVEYHVQTNGDPAAAIEVAAVFSDYSLDGGLMMPHHIQRYFQRTLEADIHITSVVTQ